MMRFPILLLLLFPVLELWLMITIGAKVGGVAVIVWLAAMIFIGVNLLRHLGASSMLRAAQGVRSGGVMPAQALANGLFKAVGAVLLIIPGFISDFFALLCFIPLLRSFLLKRWLTKMAASARARGFTAPGFSADPFSPSAFTRTTGTTYDHEGAPGHRGTTGSDADESAGLVIEHQPDSTSSKTPRSD